MGQFRVGQRARIVLPTSSLNGKEATITEIIHAVNMPIFSGQKLVHEAFTGTRYRVCIDGVGTRSSRGLLSYEASALRPLADPRAEEFIADMERYAHIAKDKVRA